jgi:hypothetical protein
VKQFVLTKESATSSLALCLTSFHRSVRKMTRKPNLRNLLHRRVVQMSVADRGKACSATATLLAALISMSPCVTRFQDIRAVRF